ncbi:malectin domain-containing carbohydrate-binding protein [Segetibacter koreensis]|uniref:malectin domain-containing carbohydrate-binding protein n=1 Tax=Segetibacter koreensis TaxID=398037 RepID=UPI00035D17BB|nr:malectin domain-containing carbohydrate-binding protein [Segetibacter koreensis]
MNKIYFSPYRQKLSRLIVKLGLLVFILLSQHAAVSAQSPDTSGKSNASLFIENLDKFPSNERFVFSRVQNPFSRDSVNGTNYNANHDSLTVRIHNNGINKLVITNLVLSNDTAWQLVKLKGANYVADSSLPLTITSGSFADLTVKFIAVDAGTRVKILRDTLTVISNDDKFPSKLVYLNGLWQRWGESNNEPHAQEIINAFGFTSKTGFTHTDPDFGDSTKLKGDEIKPSFFVRADTTRPVMVRQIAAYHSCCTFTEKIMWYVKGSDSLKTIFTHIGRDAQSLLPRKATPNTPASGNISPTTPFGFKVGSKDNTDASKNPKGKIGFRIWKAYDANRNIIPNSYIVSNDYLGTEVTNYDYNDNTYFITNLRPESGPAFSSALKPTPSDIDFGEKILQTNSSFKLKLSSLGQIYPDSSADPAIKISSIEITGENKSEFAAVMPSKTTLNPQDSTTLTVNFKPVTQGLKIADLLIHYNNSTSPLRVPLYGIGRALDTMVVVNYRINSGSSSPLTINGKTWAADNQYAFDNIEPYTNPRVHEIAGTDEDSLYLIEQSSNKDKRPFRYEFPIENGDYVVRLHFADIYWGAPGLGINGGAGSRIMNIALENQLRLVNFDVTQEVGGGATALIKNLPVTVTDGHLNIDFSATVNRPMVMAVEVYSFRASTILSSAPVVPNVDTSRLQNTGSIPTVFPNPIHKTFKIKFPAKYARRNPTLQIADELGHIYPIGKVKIPAGGTTINVDVNNLSLKPGIYYLRILPETGNTDVIKLVIP